MTYEIWWVGCMNIYGRFLLRSVVLILVLCFLLRLSPFMLRFFDRFSASRPFLVDLKMSLCCGFSSSISGGHR